MQRSDLDRAAELFDLAGDGRDEATWARRFQDHIGQVMRRHGANLRAGGGAAEQRVELLRAKLELHDVVAERLEARASGLDTELGELLRRLRLANAPLVAELTSCSSSSSRPRSAEAPQPAPPAPTTPPATSRQRRGSPQPSPRTAESRPPPPAVGPGPAAALEASPGGAGRAGGAGSYGRLHEARRQREAMPASARAAAERGASAGGAALGARPEKELTLRNLRTIISMVYASKAQHDERCEEMREPRETMEQHLYSFLGKRYGHKALVEEWARAIFRAIEREAPRECDVAVFGKILQNRLAENFAPVPDTLCKTVSKLLHESLQQRFPQRSASDIDCMYRAWTRAGVPLAECEKVVRWMYDEVDCERVLQRLLEMPRQAQPQEGAGPAEAELLRHREFLQTLVGFQMRLTEEFLADFVQLFAEVDADDDGIVSGPQLQEILHRLVAADGLGPAAAAGLDEAREGTEQAMRGRQSATFSECVEIYAALIGARSAVSEGPVGCPPVEEEPSEEEEVALEEN